MCGRRHHAVARIYPGPRRVPRAREPDRPDADGVESGWSPGRDRGLPGFGFPSFSSGAAQRAGSRRPPCKGSSRRDLAHRRRFGRRFRSACHSSGGSLRALRWVPRVRIDIVVHVGRAPEPSASAHGTLRQRRSGELLGHRIDVQGDDQRQSPIVGRTQPQRRVPCLRRDR